LPGACAAGPHSSSELIDNDRCIGGIPRRCARKHCPSTPVRARACITTSARAAEMVKLVENSFRAVNIAFANELSCSPTGGIDVWEVIGWPPPPARQHLQPGPASAATASRSTVVHRPCHPTMPGIIRTAAR